MAGVSSKITVNVKADNQLMLAGELTDEKTANLMTYKINIRRNKRGEITASDAANNFGA